jgi:hypothetical protein
MLQLRIYKKAAVTPSAWVRVKYPHFVNAAVRRFNRRNPLSGHRRTAPPR